MLLNNQQTSTGFFESKNIKRFNLWQTSNFIPSGLFEKLTGFLKKSNLSKKKFDKIGKPIQT